MAKSKAIALAVVLLTGAGAAVLFGQAPRESRPLADPAQEAGVVVLDSRMVEDTPDGIAWGKTAGGLRAGIGFRAGDRRVYRSDDSVTLVVYLRNVGGKAVSLSYPETRFAEHMPAVQDADGFPLAVAPGPTKVGDVPLVRLTLEPGEQITLGYPWFRVRPPSWRGPVVGPTLRTGPGKYRVAHPGLPLRLDGAGKDFTGPPTGWVEWEIEQGAEARAEGSERPAAPPRIVDDAGPVYFSRKVDIRIPFTLGRAEGEVRELKLYVSSDEGATWRLMANAAPTDKAFRFHAPRDGLYGFVVQTEDRAGRLEPPDLAMARSQMKVCVDTKSPAAKVSWRWRGRDLELGWEVRDDNLDPATLRVEYRAAGQSGPWCPLKVSPQADGKVTWRPAVEGKIEVRLRVADRADNEAEVKGEVEAARPEQLR